MSAAQLQDLQARWTTLYREILPALAQARSATQTRWPVHLDHCFARVILDNAVGQSRPWTEVVKAPAARNMSVEQLRAAIELGDGIAEGRENLGALDARSLELRGKTKGDFRTGNKRKSEAVAEDEGRNEEVEKAVRGEEPRKKKSRKGEMADLWSFFSASKDSNFKAGHNGLPAPDSEPSTSGSPRRTKHIKDDPESLNTVRRAITADKSLTAFRKQALIMLTEIPHGQYSTYQAMSDHISKTSHKTCARAIGNAMRNNPYAPGAPCHRILATGGRLGGFKGDWGEDGRFANQKKRLLREEGVKFDGKGVVVGLPFRDFH